MAATPVVDCVGHVLPLTLRSRGPSLFSSMVTAFTPCTFVAFDTMKLPVPKKYRAFLNPGYAYPRRVGLCGQTSMLRLHHTSSPLAKRATHPPRTSLLCRLSTPYHVQRCFRRNPHNLEPGMRRDNKRLRPYEQDDFFYNHHDCYILFYFFERDHA